MKEKLITERMKKRELITFLICFAVAFIFNIIGVVLYKSPAKEVITKMHIVLLVAVILYVAIIILRAIYYLLSRLWFYKRLK